MNILITGCKGFLARELAQYFKSNHAVIATDRTTLDPTDIRDVIHIFETFKIDVVLHTAARGGKRTHKEDVDDLYDNLAMFNNLAKFSNHYKAMFHFGSGAAFDRSCDINLAIEDDIYKGLPSDYYGLSKNLIARKINELDTNIFNLRLFGCFGVYEEKQRLFRSLYKNTTDNKPLQIHQDKYMDYFYAQDVGLVIDYLIDNVDNVTDRDYNLCYKSKHKLSALANKIKYLTNSPQDVIISNNDINNSYTGSSDRLNKLNINLLGLHGGLKNCLNTWNKIL